LAYPQIVLNVLHAGNIFRDVLGPPLGLTVVHGSGQGDFAVLHADIDFRGIDKWVIGQPVIDVIPDSVIGSGITPGTTAPVLSGTQFILVAPALGIPVTEPGTDLVARSIPETPLIATTIIPFIATAIIPFIATAIILTTAIATVFTTVPAVVTAAASLAGSIITAAIAPAIAILFTAVAAIVTAAAKLAAAIIFTAARLACAVITVAIAIITTATLAVFTTAVITTPVITAFRTPTVAILIPAAVAVALVHPPVFVVCHETVLLC